MVQVFQDPKELQEQKGMSMFATEAASEKDRKYFEKHPERTAYFRKYLKGEYNSNVEYTLVEQIEPGLRKRYPWPFPLPGHRDNEACLAAVNLVQGMHEEGSICVEELEKFLAKHS